MALVRELLNWFNEIIVVCKLFIYTRLIGEDEGPARTAQI